VIRKMSSYYANRVRNFQFTSHSCRRYSVYVMYTFSQLCVANELTEINVRWPEVIYEFLGIFDLRSRGLKIIKIVLYKFLIALHIVCEIHYRTSLINLKY